MKKCLIMVTIIKLTQEAPAIYKIAYYIQTVCPIY